MIRPAFLPLSPRRKGFTLVELAIVLAVAALLFAGLWRLMSGGSQQMKDQATADQAAQLSEAIKGFLGSANGLTFRNACGAGPCPINLPTTFAGCVGGETGICDFLPAGFIRNTTNPYNQTYEVRYLRTGTDVNNYSFLVRTAAGETIPDTSGGRIASIIGNEGGFIYNTNVCNAPTAEWACGAYGSWAVNSVVTYGYPGGASGHVAVRGVRTEGVDANIWLARSPYMTGALRHNPSGTTADTPEYHTISQNTFMDGVAAFDLNGSTLRGTRDDASVRLSLVTNGAANASLIAASTCVSTTYPHPACQEAIRVNGDQTVTGLLYANRLFADYFIYNTSDMRRKHDLKPIENALDNLGKIRALSFLMNGSDEKKLGVVAQDVEKVYPELIQQTGDGYMSVDYMGLIGPLLAAVHELKAENDQLRKEIRQQATSLERLEKKLAKKGQ